MSARVRSSGGSGTAKIGGRRVVADAWCQRAQTGSQVQATGPVRARQRFGSVGFAPLPGETVTYQDALGGQPDLAVDDTQRFRRTAGELLAARGFEHLGAATGGEAALVAASRACPDGMLLDIARLQLPRARPAMWPAGGRFHQLTHTEEDVMAQSHPARTHAGTWIVITLLLAAALIGTLWVPFYNHTSPALWGLPFFYWYQLMWVPIVAILSGVAYLLTKMAQRGSASSETANGTAHAPDKGPEGGEPT